MPPAVLAAVSLPHVQTPPPLRRPAPLLPERTIMLCVDVQERLSAAIPASFCSGCAKTRDPPARGRRAGVPVLVSEQYKRAWATRCRTWSRRSRRGRGALRSWPFRLGIGAGGAGDRRFQRPLAGHRLWHGDHICVFQTTRDLCHTGFSVHLPHDAVASTRSGEHAPGAGAGGAGGAVVTSVETVLFDLLPRRLVRV